MKHPVEMPKGDTLVSVSITLGGDVGDRNDILNLLSLQIQMIPTLSRISNALLNII